MCETRNDFMELEEADRWVRSLICVLGQACSTDLNKPAIFDDVPVHMMDANEIKVFGDHADEDALLCARWGGAAFVQNQKRQIRSNSYGIENEASVKSPHYSQNAFR